MKKSFVMLTFDLEEFDIPQEYGQEISERDQILETLKGLRCLLAVLDRYDIRVTFFVTAHFAEQNDALIRFLAEKHEIASHGLYHSAEHIYGEADLIHSKRILESIIGREILGFRMPRMKVFNKGALLKWGFRYDSSINPTWIPGRYNRLREKPIPTVMNGLVELPCSTSPFIRFPLFWLSFKNLPIGVYGKLCALTLKRRKNLLLYFHPWEFSDIGIYELPWYISEPNGIQLLNKLDKLIRMLKDLKTEFVTCETYMRYLVSKN